MSVGLIAASVVNLLTASHTNGFIGPVINVPDSGRHPDAGVPRTWVGPAGTGSWSVAANWNPAAAPAAGDLVAIVNTDNTARTVIYDVGAPVLGSLTIDLLNGVSAPAVGTMDTLSNTGRALSMTGFFTIGNSGNGQMLQTGGTVTLGASGGLTLGSGIGSTGTYTMSLATAVLNCKADEVIGVQGNAVFLQNNGSNLITSDLTIAASTSSTASYTLANGTLSVGTNTIVGNAGTASFVMNGGTATLGSLLSIGTGTYSQTAGVSSIGSLGSGTVNIATNSSTVGVMAVTGGTCTVSGNTYIGGSSSGMAGDGVLSVKNASMSVTGLVKVLNTGTPVTSQLKLDGGGNLSVGTLDLSGFNGGLGWTSGSLTVNNQIVNATTVTVPNAGTLSGNFTSNANVVVSAGGNINPGATNPGLQTYASGVNLNGGGGYNWKLATPPTDSATGTRGTTFDAVNVTAGNLRLAGTSNLNVNLGLLAAGDQPGGANNNAFWSASHIWSNVMNVAAPATNVGGTNFATLTNGAYPTGNFASRLNPDGASIDLVYNLMKVGAMLPGDPATIGSVAFGPSNYGPNAVSLTSTMVTKGSISVTGLDGLGDESLSMFLFVKDTVAPAADITELVSELNGAQVGGALDYAATGYGATSIPAQWMPFQPDHDSGIEVVFPAASIGNVSATVNALDWGAGSPNVLIDRAAAEVTGAVTPEPSTIALLTLGVGLLARRRRA